MKRAVYVPPLSEQQRTELDRLYRKTEIPRVRARAQMVLLSAERRLKAEEIAAVVRESSVTVLRWLHRYISEGGDVFYYADEFNVSWLPALRKMWSPKGQQVMIQTPGQPKVHYGLGPVNYHTGESVVIIRKRKRRQEVAELLQALLDQHATGTIYVAWDNAITHQDDEVEAVVRAAAGRLVLLYLPTYSPWLNPMEMLWRHFRRKVTHCELFLTLKDLVAASYDFLHRYNQVPQKTLSIIGAIPK